MSAINILTAKSLFLNIITIFFGTTGDLLAGAKRKEKLWPSKRPCSSQNEFFTQIATDVQGWGWAAGTEQVNQPPHGIWAGGEAGKPHSRLSYGHCSKDRLSWYNEGFLVLTIDSTAINSDAPNSYLDSHKCSGLCQELLSLWPPHYSDLPYVAGWGLHNFSLPLHAATPTTLYPFLSRWIVLHHPIGPGFDFPSWPKAQRFSLSLAPSQ